MAARQSFVGIVVQVAEGLATVRVQRHKIHPHVEKFVTYYKNFACTNGAAALGDTVRIASIERETPSSPAFEVSTVLCPGRRFTDPVTHTTLAALPQGYYPPRPPPVSTKVKTKMRR